MIATTKPDFPRWLIDDTADITNARVFVFHTYTPRFLGELLPDDEAPPGGATFSAPNGQTLCRVVWFDPPEFDGEDICRSLAAAIRHHEGVRG